MSSLKESELKSDPRWAAERLAVVRSMASLVGHGARNRLTVVRGALELLDAGCAQELTAEQTAAFLKELDRFLEDFNLGLEMMRCRPADSRVMSARQALADAADCWRAPAARAGVVLLIDDRPGPDEIFAQPLLLRQTLLNLLRNATTALAGRRGGIITLRSVRGEPWRFEVEDNGPGLPTQWQEGVGLTLCRDAMTVMNGNFEIASGPNRSGARFSLLLPLPRSNTLGEVERDLNEKAFSRSAPARVM